MKPLDELRLLGEELENLEELELVDDKSEKLEELEFLDEKSSKLTEKKPTTPEDELKEYEAMLRLRSYRTFIRKKNIEKRKRTRRR